MPEFVHLHCHTEYSLLDGAIRIKDLCARAKDYGMESVAITDHGNLFGAIDFYTQARSFGLKPIIGCEVYVAHTNRFDRDSALARTRYHLVLLAQNLTGYQNLLKLVSSGFTEGYYYKPRIDKEILAKHSEGLIALSACLAGEIPRILMTDQNIHRNAEDFGDGSPDRGGLAAAIEMAEVYSRMFPGRFYLEIQENGLEEQRVLNQRLLELAEVTKLPLVATNDCHYLDKDDVDAHDILLCIQTQNTINDERRMKFETRELYYKTPEEMETAFAYAPQALENTLLIAEQCNIELDLKSYHFPQYTVSPGKSLDEELRELSQQRLQERIESAPHRAEINEIEYQARLEHELDVICSMGFAGYFLIVQDFINWAKDKGIPVGPGRGSAAGSLVAWALKITDLDPIPYNLLFERFLNSERISMPDIDVDFCERRRSEVMDYVAEKYGSDSVAQITTFGKMKAKAVVRDVGRALGMSYADCDRIAKLIPEELKMTVKKAMDQEPELATLYNTDGEIRRLLDTSIRLEGLNRHASTHAAGVVISDKPMVEYLPLYKGKNDEIVTQFDMKMVEKIGLIKFDFLGLRTMTLIQDTLDIIGATGKKIPDLANLPLDDQPVYELYSRGDTYGIFQVESSGMRRYLTMLRPSVFEDIIAMLALYRPGPLGSGMVDEFILRKHGQVEVTYPLESLKECLKDTYGVIVYQEQVMQIAQIVAGYTLGQADLLRRAMGKKNVEEMAKERVNFVGGAKERGVPEAKANEIFDLMEKFAEYGFNKSHSAAYALISYFTAYLKAHFPVEFMAALLTSEISDQDKLLRYVTECKDMGIEVLQPNVQLSHWAFSVHNGAIVFGLGAIKNLGKDAVKELVADREENGSFASLLDFCTRVNSRKLNKRALESMIKGGAFDCFEVSRSALINGLEGAVARAQKRIKDKASNQASLFSIMGEVTLEVQPGLGFDCPEQDLEEWGDDIKLAFEKEALGFYLTSHPLEHYRQEMLRINSLTVEDAREFAPGSEVKLAVLITHVKEYINKKGDKMAFCQMEDLTGLGECTFLPKEYEAAKVFLGTEQPLLIEGRIDSRQGYTPNNNGNGSGAADEEEENTQKELKVTVNSARLLSDICEQSDAPVPLFVEPGKITENNLSGLSDLLAQFPGRAPVDIYFIDEGLRYHLRLPNHNIKPGHYFYKMFNEWKSAS